MQKIKIPFNLKSVGALLEKAKGKLSILLWLFLGVITILVGFMILQEMRKVSSVQTDTAGILDRIVRVNMGQHESLVQQLGENASFQPWPVSGADAFGLAPATAR